MAAETVFSETVRLASVRSAYDECCRRLLSDRMVLAWIMKACMVEYQDVNVEEIARDYIEGEPGIASVPLRSGPFVRGMATEDASMSEESVFYDIRYVASAPSEDGLIGLIINVEGQNRFHPGYPLVKRGIYYCSRMLAAEYGTEFSNAHYEHLKKVYSVWICPNPPAVRENTIVRYGMEETSLVGSVDTPRADYDLLNVVIVCLGGPEPEKARGVLRLLGILLSSEVGLPEKKAVLENEFRIPMTEEFESEVTHMCNLSEGVWEKGLMDGYEKGLELGTQQGIEQGLQQGIEQGLQQGMAQGLQRGMERGLQQGMERGLRLGMAGALANLVQNTGCSPEQAMDMLGVPEQQREELCKELASRP